MLAGAVRPMAPATSVRTSPISSAYPTPGVACALANTTPATRPSEATNGPPLSPASTFAASSITTRVTVLRP